jgi:hypothetical protein
MSSLAELPEVIGFFSYSREDDEAFEGTLSALRDGIQRELSAQLGRSRTTFRLWQDRSAIAPRPAVGSGNRYCGRASRVFHPNRDTKSGQQSPL